MSLVNFSDIQNLDDATPELWNSRYGAILNVLNGNIDATNLADNAVTTAKLASGAVTDSKVAAGGLVPSKMSNPYKFKAHSASDQTGVVANTWTTVALGAEDYDTGNSFASNTFTVPVTGFYQFNVNLYSSQTAGLYWGFGARLLKNGATVVLGGEHEAFDNNWSADRLAAKLSDCIELTATDTIVLQGLVQLSSGTGGFAGTFSSLSGHLVSAT